MFRRWLIRGILVAGLLVSLAAWAGSYVRPLAVQVPASVGSERYWQFGSDRGGLWVQSRDFLPLKKRSPWEIECRRFPPHVMHPHRFAGFTWGREGWCSGEYREAAVPLYAPTLFAAAAAFFTWRLTRLPRLPRPGHAFPVELAKT